MQCAMPTFIIISRRFLSIVPTKRMELHKTSVVSRSFNRGFNSFKTVFFQAPPGTSTMQSSDSRGDHLMRTSKNSRDDGIHSMIVNAIKPLSPTIKEVVLTSETLPAPFTFKAGQWVDVFIPGVETVGGFSMCSSPDLLTSCGRLRLAIKYSTHPPALWMHEKCQVGDKVNVRVGGDFHLTFGNEKNFKRILLIAGGVGINPLSSMVHYAMDDISESATKLFLLYSAKIKDELIFKEEFDKYSNMNQNFSVKYFVTDKSQLTPHAEDDNFQYKRICNTDLKCALTWLTESETTPNYDANVQAYICGPPSMIQEVTEELRALNITNVHFEKWW